MINQLIKNCIKNDNCPYYLLLLLIFFVGIFFRTYLYLQCRPFDADESHLYLSIYNSYNYFAGLSHGQVCPPFFLYIVKFVTYFGGQGEISYRFFPYFVSIISIFIFYLLSTKVLKNIISILIINFIFAINFYLNFYAQDFKQYEFDMLIVMLSILFFSNFNIKYKDNLFDYFKYGIFLFIPLLFSIPYLFSVCAFFIQEIFRIDFKNSKEIKRIVILIGTFTICSIVYYVFCLKNMQLNLLHEFPEYWKHTFLKFDFNHIYHLISKNFSYVYYPNNFNFIKLLLPLSGIICFCRKKIGVHMLLILTVAILFSFLSLYPLGDRIILYQFPILFLMTIMPFDFVLNNYKNDSIKLKLCAIIIIIIMSLYSLGDYVFKSSSYFKNTLMMNLRVNTIPHIPILGSKFLIHDLIKYLDDTNVIFINWGSEGPFMYYKNLYYPDKNIKYYFIDDYNKEVFDVKRSTLILYMPQIFHFDIENTTEFENNVVYKNKLGISYLYVFKNSSMSDILKMVIFSH